MNLNLRNKIGEYKKEENTEENSLEAAWDGEKEKFEIGSRSNKKFFENRIAREQKQTKTSLEEARWLTTGEAAQYLRVSISSIKMMIYRGKLRAHKLGRRNRFLRDELDRQITFSN